MFKWTGKLKRTLAHWFAECECGWNSSLYREKDQAATALENHHEYSHRHALDRLTQPVFQTRIL